MSMVGVSSWSIELLFREVRIVSSENFVRRLSNLAMWQRATHSNVVEDFGTAPLVVQPEDEAETRGALPEKVFNSQKVDFSASEKFFERCLSGKRSWPSPRWPQRALTSRDHLVLPVHRHL